MLSEVRTFGERLSKWMEENNLTPSDLAVYTRETRDATIARLMHDQLDYQRCARYITELAQSYPGIDEETLKRLRLGVDVNRYGKELFLAKQNFFRMIAGDEKSVCCAQIGEFCEEILAWSEGMSFQLLCVGFGDTQPQRMLTSLSKKRKDIHIYSFFDKENVGELSGLLAETLPIAFNPNYELFEINNNRGAMMNNVMIAKREDGRHLLVAYDGDRYLTLPMPSEAGLFDFSLNILFSKYRAPKKINRRFTQNNPLAFKDFLMQCMLLEKDKAIYEIKTEIGLEYVPVPILLENFCQWACRFDTSFLPFIDELKEIFEKRYENILSKKEPTYLIMTREGMTEFAKTGRMKDHPFCLRPFTPAERKEILKNLLEISAKSASITPLFFSSESISLDYSFIGYSRACILVCAAQADYDLNNYTEVVLDSKELAGQFADFVTGILIKNHVLSKKASIEFIQTLIDMIDA